MTPRAETFDQGWLLDVPRNLPVCVRKRQGTLVQFEPAKLAAVLEKIGRAEGEFGPATQALKAPPPGEMSFRKKAVAGEIPVV
jgi:hypothetical protein